MYYTSSMWEDECPFVLYTSNDSNKLNEKMNKLYQNLNVPPNNTSGRIHLKSRVHANGEAIS